MSKNNFYEDLKKYFEETPREKVLEDWEKSKECDQVGPTVEDYLLNEIAEFHRVKLEDLGFTEWDRDVMGYLEITPGVELYFDTSTNIVHLYNDVTGDYFGLGTVEKFEHLETLVSILKQIMR